MKVAPAAIRFPTVSSVSRQWSRAGSPAIRSEAARVAMTRYTKRGGRVWIKIFPTSPVSMKALGVRMGSGKGAPEYWVAVIRIRKSCSKLGVSEPEAREYCVLLSTATHQDEDHCQEARKPRMVVNKMEQTKSVNYLQLSSTPSWQISRRTCSCSNVACNQPTTTPCASQTRQERYCPHQSYYS